MESITTFFKEENDFLYRKGEGKGVEKERLRFVKYFITQSDKTDAEISEVVKVPISFVKSVREELKITEQYPKLMESIITLFKEENNFLYRKGQEKGVEKGTKKTKREMVVKMKESGLEINLISSITGLSVEEIKKL